MHWCEKSGAKAGMAEELMERGWRVYGYHGDKSDSMTDYYSPAHWDGIATKETDAGELAILVVDQSKGELAHEDVRTEKGELVKPCKRCNGDESFREAWTLRQAQENPQAYNRADDEARNDGSVSLMGLSSVVSPIPFNDDGSRPCFACNGSRGQWSHVRVVERVWPAYQGNPGRCNWHLEIGGRIVAKGVGVFKAFQRHQLSDDLSSGAKRLLAKIDAAMAGGESNVSPYESGDELARADGLVVSEGKPGNVELRFAEKPDEGVRDELKAAKFRWSRFNRCWYGRAERYPRLVARGIAPEITSGSAS